MVILNVARALHNFRTEVAGDLQFNAGDVVLVTGKIDDAWLHGETVDGAKGIFPLSFVYEEVLPSLGVGEAMLIATGDFTAQTPDDLTISKGDIIVGKRRVDSNWWHGECHNKRGIFPACFVRTVVVQKAVDQRKPPFHGVAKASLKAQPPGEIDLQEGDEVIVEELIDQWWCRGMSRGQRGMFPRAFVQINQMPPVAAPKVPSEVTSSSAVQAYGNAKFKFQAQCSGELSFEAGQRLNLIGHVDKEWTLCKLNNQVGIVPTGYLDIVVDCPQLPEAELRKAIAAAQIQNSHIADKAARETTDWVGKTFRVAHDFPATVSGDLSASLDDYVRVSKSISSYWVEAVNLRTLDSGIIPASFLCPLSPKANGKEEVKWRQNGQGGQVDRAIAHVMTSLEIDTKSRRLSEKCSPVKSMPTVAAPVPAVVPVAPVKKGPPPPRPRKLPAVRINEMPKTAVPLCNGDNVTSRAAVAGVFKELLDSERDYMKNITLLHEACKMHSAKYGISSLTHKLGLLVSISSNLVSHLEDSPSVDAFARFFNNACAELASAYIGYCTAYEEASVRLRDADTEALFVTLKASGQCFDISTTFVRPIQRFLRYPMYLSNLLKSADPASEAKLRNALCQLSSALRWANDKKRRNDVVHKYRTECQESFAQRLSKFSVHSMRKKSSRLGVRLSSTFGLTQLPSDNQFDCAQSTFHEDMRNVRMFLQHVRATVARALNTVTAHKAMANACKLSSLSHTLNSVPLADALNNLRQSVKQNVDDPLVRVQSDAKVLARLIDKRRDKLFDCEAFEARVQKAIRNGDNSKVTAQCDALKKTRDDYNDLNEQLIEELAEFHVQVQGALGTARSAFAQDVDRFNAQLGNVLQSSSGKVTMDVDKPVDNTSLISFEDDNQSVGSSSNLGDLLGAIDDMLTTEKSKNDPWSADSKSVQRNNVLQLLTVDTDEFVQPPLQPTSAYTCATNGDSVPRDFKFIQSTSYRPAPAAPQQSTSSSPPPPFTADDVDEFCVASYDFIASGSDELSVQEGDIVVVHDKCDLQGNAEWWLVESEVGDFGYVPATYLKPYTIF